MSFKHLIIAARKFRLRLILGTVIPMLLWLLFSLSCQGAEASDGIFSTNWLAAVKAAMPDQSLKGDVDFGQATNLLCQESQRGNNSAQGLWGFTLLVASRSPEDAKAGLQLLSDSAEKGDVPAMLNLGFLYEGGKYVRKNYTEAFHWFGLAADKGNAEAQLELGGCYHYGLGTTPNLTMAATCYHHAAEQTNYVAMKSFGYLLMNGMGVETNLETARYWLTRAANEGGNRRAMFDLGALCSMNFPDTNSMVEAFQWYKQSAELGDALGCYELAKFYYCGWGAVETNLANYHTWLIKAALLGDTEAQYLMAVACRTGDWVPQNIESSLVWYQKAAAKNDPRAFYDLALHYLADKTNHESLILADRYMHLAAQAGHRAAQFQCAMSSFRGDVSPADFETGRQWLAQSAEAGWAPAEFCLYQLYYNIVAPGLGLPLYPKDKVEAVKWLRQAAAHGSLEAQSALAVKMIQGTEVEMDKPAAENLLRNAAEHGYAEAQNDLGFAIEHGDISSTDIVESAMWINLAESHVTDQSVLRRIKINLSNITLRLTLDQQLEVDRRVKKFQALPVVVMDPMPAGWDKSPSYQKEDGQFGH
jgi:TPR repeat protein